MNNEELLQKKNRLQSAELVRVFMCVGVGGGGGGRGVGGWINFESPLLERCVHAGICSVRTAYSISSVKHYSKQSLFSYRLGKNNSLVFLGMRVKNKWTKRMSFLQAVLRIRVNYFSVIDQNKKK